jgi:hypothetical protein
MNPCQRAAFLNLINVVDSQIDNQQVKMIFRSCQKTVKSESRNARKKLAFPSNSIKSTTLCFNGGNDGKVLSHFSMRKKINQKRNRIGSRRQIFLYLPQNKKLSISLKSRFDEEGNCRFILLRVSHFIHLHIT